MPAVEPSGTFRFQIRKKKCFNRFSAFQHHLVSSFFLLLRVHIKPWSFIFQISRLLVSTVYGKSRQQNLKEKMFNRTKTTKNHLLGWMNHTSVFTTTEKRNGWAEFSWEKKKNIFWEKKRRLVYRRQTNVVVEDISLLRIDQSRIFEKLKEHFYQYWSKIQHQ